MASPTPFLILKDSEVELASTKCGTKNPKGVMATDAELIGASLAGDREAFVGVVLRHEVAVSAYLSRRVGSGLAQDLLSEVWLAAFKSRSTYERSIPDARPWLFGVARNTLRRHWRSMPLEVPLSDAEIEIGKDPWPALDERIDTAAALRNAVMGLRPLEREVLALVVWEDLSVVDAARSLGIPQGSAYRILHQARQNLRNAPGMVDLLNSQTILSDTK
jgi:RNA polymerase sigma-70 factor (ECF subfamily)